MILLLELVKTMPAHIAVTHYAPPDKRHRAVVDPVL
jgi:hypothetical protein